MSASPDIETAVIGAGVIGLAIAAACARRGQEVIVLERNGAIGQETSSRSSEVVHAGIYYPKGSLKARLCVEGRDRLYRFAEDNAIAASRLGKLIVATSPAEVAALAGIAERARANGVDDLRNLSSADVHAIEPDLACTAGLLSPSTGIIDSHVLMQVLEGHLTTHRGMVVKETAVRRVAISLAGLFEIETTSGGEDATLTARNLVVAAGLGMSELAAALPHVPAYAPPATTFAKGHYCTLAGQTPFRHLVYPVPVEGGLGTHLTLDMDGRARFGPDVEWIERPDYSFGDPGPRISAFETAIRRYWPGLPAGALQPGYTGIRPKISKKGEPARDFEIHGEKAHGVPRMVALYGIESPGLTASLAIADLVGGMLA